MFVGFGCRELSGLTGPAEGHSLPGPQESNNQILKSLNDQSRAGTDCTNTGAVALKAVGHKPIEEIDTPRCAGIARG